MKPSLRIDWRGYRPVALVAQLPEELSQRSGVVFRDSHDDLDSLKESAFSGSTGTIFGLVSHAGSPVPGTEILVHQGEVRRGVETLVSEALDALHLSREDLRWTLDAETARSRNVFVSLASDDDDTRELVSQLLEELSAHGFKAVTAESAVRGQASLALLRDMIEQCRLVVLAGSVLPHWAFFELGVAAALEKPVWRLFRDRFMRWDEAESVEELSQSSSSRSGSTDALVDDLISSLERS